MGQHGPKPTPAALLAARGNRKLAKARKASEPATREGVPTAPEFLDDEGRRYWARLCKSMTAARVMSRDYREGMASLCVAWSLFVKCSKRLTEALAKADAQPDVVTMRRLQSMVSDASTSLARGLAAFGLTPADRSRIGGAVQRAEPSNSKARFFTPRLAE